MSAGSPRVPPPVNEPNLSYLPGSPEREALKARLASMASEKADIPLIIGGCEIRTGQLEHAVMPRLDSLTSMVTSSALRPPWRVPMLVQAGGFLTLSSREGQRCGSDRLRQQ